MRRELSGEGDTMVSVRVLVLVHQPRLGLTGSCCQVERGRLLLKGGV